ncbi:hypothetical protein [Arthrobacter sp. KNU40]|uniref:hypothetical protein n=1 Tax=Arthrobacter sp. KNU40 TaxID=3447965 RepID=UPI003F62C1D2
MLPSPPPVIINMPDTGAPWWGVPLLAGIFVLIGALAAFLSTRASDRRKSKNEDARRYDEEIKNLGGKFLTNADEYKKKSQDYARLSKSSTIRSVTDPKTGKMMRQTDIALRDKSKAQHKANEALNQLSFVAPERLHAACRAMLVSALRIDMHEKNDPETDEEFRRRRHLVLNELRRTIKLRPLPRKAPLRARMMRRIRNPKSFWTDFQKLRRSRRENKAEKKLTKNLATDPKKETV